MEKHSISYEVLVGISHMVSCPRLAWAFFVIFFLLHGFARTFSKSAIGISLAQGMFWCHFWLQCHFSFGCEDTSSMVSSIRNGECGVRPKLISVIARPRARAGVLAGARLVPSRSASAHTGRLAILHVNRPPSAASWDNSRSHRPFGARLSQPQRVNSPVRIPKTHAVRSGEAAAGEDTRAP